MIQMLKRKINGIYYRLRIVSRASLVRGMALCEIFTKLLKSAKQLPLR